MLRRDASSSIPSVQQPKQFARRSAARREIRLGESNSSVAKHTHPLVLNVAPTAHSKERFGSTV